MSTRSGTLYLVPTPIGNLEDMTFRAIRVLKEVDRIYCEDTRRSGTLMQHFDIHTPLESLFVGNEHEKAAALVDRLKKGEDLALISDAGTPAIADPGYLVVRACREAGLTVVPLPGPSALAAALSGSGLPTERVHFWGFVPRKPGERKRFLTQALAESATVALYESPHRIEATLQTLAELDGERKVVLCRELSKMHEDIAENTAAGWVEHPPKVRGEFVLLIAADEGGADVEADPVARYHQLLQENFAPKAALKIAAKEAGLKSKELYDRIHRPGHQDH